MLHEDGWMLVRTKRSHRQFQHPVKKGLVTVPGRNGADLSIGTFKSILKQAKLQPRPS